MESWQRFARCVNRVFGRRGPVLYGRYNATLLTCPLQVRNALAYVLLNVRKHRAQSGAGAPPVRLDEASSGRWFTGWKQKPRGATGGGPCEVADPHTWLLQKGWRRRGLIDPAEVPASGPGR